MPDNAESAIKKEKNGEDDFYFFRQVVEPGTEQDPETKQNKHRSYCNAKYPIEFAHRVLQCDHPIRDIGIDKPLVPISLGNNMTVLPSQFMSINPDNRVKENVGDTQDMCF